MSSTEPASAGNTVRFRMNPVTSGCPSVADPVFMAALEASERGGDPTAAFFGHLSETAGFWSRLASGLVTFAPAVDPQGRPVTIGSDGNTSLRLVASLAPPATPAAASPSVGTVSVQTGSTSSGFSMVMVFEAVVPEYGPLAEAVLGKLGEPLLASARQLVQRMSSLVRQAAAETPQVDALQAADEAVAQQSDALAEVSGAAGEEVAFLAVDWGGVVTEVAGLAPVMAIPLILESLGHTIRHSLIVQNLTGMDFTWTVDPLHGMAAVQPGGNVIPAVQVANGVPEVADGSRLSYQAGWQFASAGNMSSIGYVLTLAPAAGQAVRAVVSIPFAGRNAIWVGASTLDAQSLYEQHSSPTGALSVTAECGDYQLTLSINALTGTTSDGVYFYCSTAVLDPLPH